MEEDDRDSLKTQGLPGACELGKEGLGQPRLAVPCVVRGPVVWA